MFKRFLLAVTLAFGLHAADGAMAAAPTPEQAAEMRAMEALLASVTPQTGSVALPSAKVTLNLGDDYYFLDATDSRRVLTEAWGNPPEASASVLGMIFPKDKTFLDDTWGAVLTFVDDGYVSDADAKDIDYDQMLTDLRKGEDQENSARVEQGYPSIALVGWARQPTYDAARHNLIWAKELDFSDSPDNTLNYDVRVLGRYGVLSMNIVAGAKDLQTVGGAATALMNTAAFNEGARYADYREGVDKKAAYGVAGLVAGGAAVAVAKKAGLIGILLLVFKKGGVFLLAGAGVAFAWLRRYFTGRSGGDFGKKPRQAPTDESPPTDPTS